MKRFPYIASAAATFLALSSGPMIAAENWPDSVDAYVAQVRKTIRTVDMEAYLAVVKTPDGSLLLDVREDNEFKAGHVPGAVNIPRGVLPFQIWRLLGYPAQVDLYRKIYVQCATGGRATLATRELVDIGFPNAVAVVMNFRDWIAKDYPLVKE
jgi:rhodanese-related sulfurtransferase